MKNRIWNLQNLIFILLKIIDMKSKRAFTLVEIIISTIILTGWVFAIYKLLSVNTNNLNNYEIKNQANSLFKNMEECIKYIWFNNFVDSTDYSFNFWSNNNWCFTWTANSWVTLDNREYFLYWSWTKSWNQMDWKLQIKEASINTQEKEFTLYK